MSDTPPQDLGVQTGGDLLTHVLHLGTNEGGDFTPDGIASAIDKLNLQVHKVDDEIHDYVAAQELTDLVFMTDWSSFAIAWSDWQTAHSSWLSDAWNSTRDELLDQRTQYENLRTRWAAIYPQTLAIPFVVKDAPTSGNALENWGKQVGAALEHIAKGAGIVLAVGVAAYLVWKFK